MNRRLLPLIVLAAFLAPAAEFPLAAAGPEDDIAIVVHPGVPVQNLTISEMRQIFMGDRQYWNPNLRITLLVRAPVARERDVVLKTIYQMSEAQFRQYWIGKVFRAENTSGPKIVYSSETVSELILNIPGSISFMAASQVPKGAKVLKANGRLPGDKGYPLH